MAKMGEEQRESKEREIFTEGTIMGLRRNLALGSMLGFSTLFLGKENYPLDYHNIVPY